MIGPSFHAPITKQAARKEVKAAQSLILKDEGIEAYGICGPTGGHHCQGQGKSGEEGLLCFMIDAFVLLV